jgi:hypothetical protein
MVLVEPKYVSFDVVQRRHVVKSAGKLAQRAALVESEQGTLPRLRNFS